MELEVEGEEIENNPGPDEIVKALSSLDGKNRSFAILSRTEFTYIQVSGSVKDGFSMEYQDGSLDKHYYCPGDMSLEVTVKAFISYARGENEWQKTLKWEPMEM